MNSTISEYIKTSRLELGLTQDELAQRAGISVRYLCDIENDHGIPSDWVYESLQQELPPSGADAGGNEGNSDCKTPQH